MNSAIGKKQKDHLIDTVCQMLKGTFFFEKKVAMLSSSGVWFQRELLPFALDIDPKIRNIKDEKQ